MKQRYLTPTERHVAALKNASAQLHELRILFGAKSDPTFYRRLKAEYTYSPCMSEVLNPIFHYLVNPFYPLDPECIELKAVFSEYQKGLHDFILNDLTHALSGSETPDDICDSLNRCYEILSKTMFNPHEPKAHDEYDELCDLFDKASDEMRERIRQNAESPSPQTPEDDDNATATKGYTHSIHRGSTFRGVKVCNDGQTLLINGKKFKFKGVKQWDVLDRIIDAHFSETWAEITSTEFKCFTTAAGKELKKNYIEREKHSGPKKGNKKFSWKVRFKVD